MVEDFLNEVTRAEDILLGSVGIDGEAKIIEIELKGSGYRGTARWPDGETTEFECEDELGDIEHWALKVLSQKRGLGH